MDVADRKTPLTSVLVKPVGSACNLSCRYCYYLGKRISGDDTAPMHMNEETLRNLIRQMMRQGERTLSFSWQGGEPTLKGIEFYERAVEYQIRFSRPGQIVGNGLQTNGLFIDKEWAKFLRDAQFLVGLSLDGPQHIHDRYRTMGRQGSWERVMQAQECLLNNGIAVNVLTVVNDYSVNFPEEIYLFHKQSGIAHMQFIPCVEKDKEQPEQWASYAVQADAFGKFLCRLFDLWWEDFRDGKPTTFIRWFVSLVDRCAGIEPAECTLQEECGKYLIVEHNGNVYSCDFFVDETHHLGTLQSESLIEMLNSPRQKRFGSYKGELPYDCLTCRWLDLCRGGCPKDRINGESGAGGNFLCRAFCEFFSYAEPRLRTFAKGLKKEERIKEKAV